MKRKILAYVLLAFALVLMCATFIGCKTPCPDAKPLPPQTEVIRDTVVLDLKYKKINDSLAMVIQRLEADNTKMHETNSKLARELLNERLVIENAKYYVDIVNRNRSQEKFLLGWMNRALKN